MMEWQPIETAPRDGSLVILYRPLAEETNDQKIAIKQSISYNNHCWDKTVPEGCVKENYTGGSCYATHWMPLPDEPVNDESLNISPHGETKELD